MASGIDDMTPLAAVSDERWAELEFAKSPREIPDYCTCWKHGGGATAIRTWNSHAGWQCTIGNQPWSESFDVSVLGDILGLLQILGRNKPQQPSCD